MKYMFEKEPDNETLKRLEKARKKAETERELVLIELRTNVSMYLAYLDLMERGMDVNKGIEDAAGTIYHKTVDRSNGLLGILDTLRIISEDIAEIKERETVEEKGSS